MASTSATVEPFERSWAVLLTTYRRDRTPVSTPVSLAVEGDHAYFRTYSKTWKAKRLRHTPEVEIAPSTFRGRPTGPGRRGQARLLEDEADRHARSLIAKQYPVFQGVLITLIHKVARYTTLHYEVSALDP